MKPPIMPNDKFASQKYQDPLATMPRICNPEAMSNDRGPAAEGVAHKIYFLNYFCGDEDCKNYKFSINKIEKSLDTNFKSMKT